MPRFIRELMEFVTLSDDDVAVIRRTAPAVLAHGDAFTRALYDHFLKFEATARFFLGDDGQPDAAKLERRRHSLARWLRETAEVATTQEFSYYLLAVGLSHSHRADGRGGAAAGDHQHRQESGNGAGRRRAVPGGEAGIGRLAPLAVPRLIPPLHCHA